LISSILIAEKINKTEAFVTPFSGLNKYNKISTKEFEKKFEPVILPMDVPLERSIRNDLWDIRRKLKSNGNSFFIVGGAVRDLVDYNSKRHDKSLKSGESYNPKDFDLVTDANPDEIQAIFEKAEFVSKIHNFGESFGVKFIETKLGNIFELATLRMDIGGGRKPNEVKYQKELIEDAKRRDITINALYYDIKGFALDGFTGNVIDYVGGIEDIKNRVIKPIGDSNYKFCEDPSRKIRTLRFAAKTHSQIPEDVSKAIRHGKTSIIDKTGKKITHERINEEFYKGIIGCDNSKFFLELLYEFDFYKHIFGKLDINRDGFVNEKNPIVTMAGLLKNNNCKEIENELLEHKFSRSEITSIIFLNLLSNLSEKNVCEMKRFYLKNVSRAIPQINEVQYPTTPEQILHYANINNIDKIKISNFVRLITELPRPSIVLSKLDILPGKEMGLAAIKLEKEFFKDPQRVSKMINSKDWVALKQLLSNKEKVF
jgi:tRNA nucleotidyltransferase/poly(A) polymerase